MKISLSILALLAAAIPLGCAKTSAPEASAPVKVTPAVAPAKATFTSQKHGFALYLPSKPEVRQQPIPADMGGGTMESFVVAPDPVAYVVVPVKLPKSAADLEQENFFDSVQEGQLESTGGTLISSRDVTFNGHTVREIEASFSTPTADSKTPVKFINQVRVYRVGDRSFQFAALVPEKQRAANQAQIDKVFNSVVINK